MLNEQQFQKMVESNVLLTTSVILKVFFVVVTLIAFLFGIVIVSVCATGAILIRTFKMVLYFVECLQAMKQRAAAMGVSQ